MSYMKELMIDFEEWKRGVIACDHDREELSLMAFTAGAALHAKEARWHQWIVDHVYGSGGGDGCVYWFYIPVDHEDMGCAIQDAIDREAFGLKGYAAKERERIIEKLRSFYPELNQTPTTAKETGEDGILEAAKVIDETWPNRPNPCRLEALRQIIAIHCVGIERFNEACNQSQVLDSHGIDVQEFIMDDDGLSWKDLCLIVHRKLKAEKARADNLRAELQAAEERIKTLESR